MNSESHELLAFITRHLEAVSVRMHEDARMAAKLRDAATALRTGKSPAVVMAELGPEYRWVYEAK